MENSHDHHDICESSSGEADQKVEVLDLLEESWFFENLFNRRRRMLRCYSDPCTSSNFSQEVLAKDSCIQNSESTKKFQDKGSAHCSLIGREEQVQERKSNDGRSKLNRQLSLQASETTCTEKIHEIQEKKTDRKSQLSGQSSRINLLRTPSLPTSKGRRELIQDNDSDIRMSKLIRQALANSSDTLPPRHSPSKAMTQSCSMQRCRRPRNLEMETTNNTNVVQEMRRRYSNQKILQKSQSDLAFQELQGFKDLGFTFDKEDLSPGVVSILPGLQENKIEDSKQDNVRRPYLSEAWLVQSHPPPIPNCVSKDSAEDMKEQLKFWARAVATNVRQEC
ncbi:uncharacterized protein LOC111276526 [Durio zibethinus]|uniref:Uncharacterized protein LOC111276526 n=1 Tax=Durio zibethinus TaxID=66656 RepID=A0A6P5WR67_DURZI|nr:uncharacterized protein LOC111276526 [Durio zibethinus]